MLISPSEANLSSKWGNDDLPVILQEGSGGAVLRKYEVRLDNRRDRMAHES
jgi:hypothetical protein